MPISPDAAHTQKRAGSQHLSCNPAPLNSLSSVRDSLPSAAAFCLLSDYFSGCNTSVGFHDLPEIDSFRQVSALHLVLSACENRCL